MPEPPRKNRIFRPDELFAILEKSPIHYRILTEDTQTRMPLSGVTDRPTQPPRPLDPFVEVKRIGPEGRLRLESSRPPESVAEIFERAGDAFALQEYELAQSLYRKVVELEPTYWKGYTYLGNSLYFLGDYLRAEQIFLKALSLNPVDYQAMLFLGDTYLQLGEHGRAKEQLTRAYLLNRDNRAVTERLNVALAKNNLRIRADRLSPAFWLEQVSTGTVVMHFEKESAARWMPLAVCMACWAYETQCQERAPEEDDPLRLAMYRECLINHAASLAVRRDQGEGGRPLLGDERALLAAIEEGMLDAIIFWEVVAEIAPMVILLLPDEVQEMILRYIERFVFVSTQVV